MSGLGSLAPCPREDLGLTPCLKCTLPEQPKNIQVNGQDALQGLGGGPASDPPILARSWDACGIAEDNRTRHSFFTVFSANCVGDMP